MNNYKVAFLVLSCDKYSDLWENYENASFSKRAIVATHISDNDLHSSTKIEEYLKYYVKKLLNVVYYSQVQWFWQKKAYLCRQKQTVNEQHSSCKISEFHRIG
jgi:hypothetical protein